MGSPAGNGAAARAGGDSSGLGLFLGDLGRLDHREDGTVIMGVIMAVVVMVAMSMGMVVSVGQALVRLVQVMVVLSTAVTHAYTLPASLKGTWISLDSSPRPRACQMPGPSRRR